MRIFYFIFMACLFPTWCFSMIKSGTEESNNGNSPYNPHNLYVAQFNPPAGNTYRSAKGVPGPEYWQNRADYLIHATLNEKDTLLSGDVTIKYTNNSPDALEYLWLQLDQNILKETSIAVAATPYPDDNFGVLGNAGRGYRISKVSLAYKGKTYEVEPVIADTRMQLRLKTPLQAKGDQISIQIEYRFKIPRNGARRFGIQPTKNGITYEIAQWYPRLCVYDDVEGWNTLPYLGFGEFYCEFGNFDYYITAPADMRVFGSGDLQNPEEVLSRQERERLAKAAQSDQTVMIVTADDTKSSGDSGKTKTWHFAMQNTRDVSWTASRNFLWDAAKINLPSGRKALAMSVYPAESAGDSAWSRSTEYLKASIEIYSENFYEYPWNTAVSSAGFTSGMEYPGIIFNNYRKKKASLWFLITHEIGHDWYPMVVCSNERRYMWQDEGVNTYINYIANDLFNHGEYKNDPEFLKKNFFGSTDYQQFLYYKDPLMTVSDAMDVWQHHQYYGRAAYGFNLLRTVIVGKERFDYAFRKYTEAWAFKHPTPYDLFRCINNATGEDLNWFWKEWFYTTWKFDQAIEEVNYEDNDPSKGALITIVNREEMILPVILQIELVNGKTDTVKLPVEIWQRGGTWIYHYPSKVKIKKLILDPNKELPDINRSNNEWVN
jgi:hypothetical protein